MGSLVREWFDHAAIVGHESITTGAYTEPRTVIYIISLDITRQELLLELILRVHQDRMISKPTGALIGCLCPCDFVGNELVTLFPVNEFPLMNCDITYVGPESKTSEWTRLHWAVKVADLNLMLIQDGFHFCDNGIKLLRLVLFLDPFNIIT